MDGLINRKTAAVERLRQAASIKPLLIDAGLFVGGAVSAPITGVWGAALALGGAGKLLHDTYEVIRINREYAALKEEIARLRLERSYLRRMV
jgi:hypothetical protein